MAKQESAALDAALEQAQAALAPFAALSPRGEMMATLPPEQGGPPAKQFTGSYRLSRCEQEAVLTGVQLDAAAACVADAKASAADLRKALAPFAALPIDYLVKDPQRPIFTFPGRGGEPVGISNGMIKAAKAALAALPG